MIRQYGFHSLFLTDVVVVMSAREVVPLYAGVSETVERHTVLWTPVRLRGVPVGERERVPRLDPEKSAFCLKIRTPDPIVHVVICICSEKNVRFNKYRYVLIMFFISSLMPQ